MPDEDADTVVLIVKNHLEMARFWQSHDIEDEGEIAKFAAIAGDEETLKLLYITTFCDASGTAEGFWNSYKQGLHESLYRETLSYIRKGAGAENHLCEKAFKGSRGTERAARIRGAAASLSKSTWLLPWPPSYFSFHNQSDVSNAHKARGGA